MTESRDLILSACLSASILALSEDFRRSSDRIPRFLGFLASQVCADCCLNDEGVVPNSVGGWIVFFTPACTTLY